MRKKFWQQVGQVFRGANYLKAFTRSSRMSIFGQKRNFIQIQEKDKKETSLPSKSMKTEGSVEYHYQSINTDASITENRGVSGVVIAMKHLPARIKNKNVL